MSEIDKIIEPIKEWYGGGTEGERTNLEILADAIADLQDNRKELFVLQAENKWLKEELIEFGRHGQGCSRQWGTKYRCKCGWEKIEQALKEI